MSKLAYVYTFAIDFRSIGPCKMLRSYYPCIGVTNRFLLLIQYSKFKSTGSFLIELVEQLYQKSSKLSYQLFHFFLCPAIATFFKNSNFLFNSINLIMINYKNFVRKIARIDYIALNRICDLILWFQSFDFFVVV